MKYIVEKSIKIRLEQGDTFGVASIKNGQYEAYSLDDIQLQIRVPIDKVNQYFNIIEGVLGKVLAFKSKQTIKLQIIHSRHDITEQIGNNNIQVASIGKLDDLLVYKIMEKDEVEIEA